MFFNNKVILDGEKIKINDTESFFLDDVLDIVKNRKKQRKTKKASDKYNKKKGK